MLIREKIRQAQGILGDLGVDCWITFVRESLASPDPVLPFLVTGHVTWHSAFLLTRTGEAHAIVGEYDRRTVEDTGAYDSVTGYVEGIGAPLIERLQRLDPARIAANFSRSSEVCDGLTHGMYLTLRDFLETVGMADRLVSAEKVISALRARKTETEVRAIREAIRLTEDIFLGVEGFIRPGRTEREIAGFMRERLAAIGHEPAWDESVCPSVFTGPDTAGAHYAPTERRVEPGHVLNMDFGVRHDGYCSDLQRTFYVAEGGETSPPEEVRVGFETILASIEAARSVLRPGSRGLDVDRAARELIVAAGYEEFPHGLGHQVGRFAHDGTALLGPAWEKYAEKPYEPIEEGMVFTIEPRLTVEGRGVVTIEEMVLVTADGAEYLSTPQKELPVLGS